MVYKFVFFCDMLSLDEEGKQGDLMSYQRRRFFNTNDIVDSLNTLDYLCIKMVLSPNCDIGWCGYFD